MCRILKGYGKQRSFLDNTSVHPESYKVAKELIKTLGYTEEDLKMEN